MPLDLKSFYKVQVIIPMSGKGSRFMNAGYKNIKPFVNVFNKPIIKYIIEQFSEEDEFIFICRKEHLEDQNLDIERNLKKLTSKATIIEVENHKLGPVHAIIQSRNYINLSEEVIVNYCDFDWRWDYKEFKKWLSNERPDAAICVYKNFQPHYINPATYAYVNHDQHNLLELREKQSFTKYREEEPAASGTFYFSSGKNLLDSCEWLVQKKLKVNNEYYVSMLFNYFAINNYRTLIYYISHFMQWGTPEDLEEFIFFAKKVPMNFKTQSIDCTSITLMAGSGSRMKKIDKIKKPYLKINDEFLYKFCTNNFKSEKDQLHAVNGDNDDNKYFKIEGNNNKKEIKVGITKSSVGTLLTALEKYNSSQDEGLFVMPCDAAIDFSWEEFKNYKNSLEKLEGVVFSFKKYPYARWMPEQYGWLETSKDNFINSIGLKQGWNSTFTNPIITGFFWFPKISNLIDQLRLFRKENIQNKSELSIDEFCKSLIYKNKKIISYEVNDFLCLGVPQEFRTYEYWLKANEIKPLN